MVGGTSQDSPGMPYLQGYSAIECPMVGGTSQDSPGMPYLLWRTGILCHRESYGGGDIPGQSRDAILTMACLWWRGHPRTVQGCRTYYGVQGYSAIVSYGGGDIPGQSRDAVLTMAYRDTLPLWWGTSQDSPGTSVIHPYTGRVIYEGIVPGHSMD